MISAFARGVFNSRPFEGREGFRLTAKHWARMGTTVVDSVGEVSEAETTWERSAGFENAWKSDSNLKYNCGSGCRFT